MKPPFPVSDHCNGWRFINPPGWRQARGFSDLPRWWCQRLFLGQGTRWPRTVSAPARPELPARVPAGQVAVTPVGHSTFLLQLAGLNLLTDPIFSLRASPFSWAGPKRVRPPALRLAELPRIDVVLVSHDHYDHLDLPSLRWLARERRPLIVTTLGNKAWLESRGVANVVALDWWQAHRAVPELEVICTPAQHFAARWPWDRCKTLWGGFMLRTAGGLIFFAGDTGWASHFAEIKTRLGAPALALLPIGAYEPRWFMIAVHMNPDEAVRAHLALGARQSLGMHFGTFQLTDEAIDAPLQALAVARTAQGVEPGAFATMNFGETRLLALR
ncbi:MAG TPA: MBL fold metallo-hydrolase [Lacunisphaera sp.]|nr:MBL fold metallo-hydrolase [Lacunisphaera sp.]